MSRTGSRRSGAGGSEAPTGRAKLQPRAQATRLAILTAAAQHFARHGYHATSLQRVLADSGGTKGALYFHFASKDALARAVIAEMMQRWSDLRRRVGELGLDPLSALLALVDEVIASLIDDPIVQGGTRLLDELPARERDALGRYGFGEHDAAELLIQAADAGLLQEGIDPALLARQIVAIVAGHRQICDVLGERHHLQQRVHGAWALLLPVIATDEWLVAWRASTRPQPSRHGDISGFCAGVGEAKGPGVTGAT